MSLALLAVRNVFRNRFRTILTLWGVAVAIVAFLFLRTVVGAWTVAVEQGAQDRIATWHRVSFVVALPKKYVDRVAEVPGVTAATWATWFGARDPRFEKEFFATLAVDTATFFDVYDEMKVPADQLAAWKEDRQGVIVGDVLAKKLGYDVGDTVTLEGGIYPGTWEFHIRGIYEATRKSVDRSQFVLHWNYVNENEQVPAARRDEIGWIISRIADPQAGGQVAETIDRMFDSSDVQTRTMSERAMNLQFLGAFSAVLEAIDLVSGVILVIMMLILGNTIAMGVRERTGEFAILKAIGFRPRHIVTLVLGEAAAIGLLGGGLGLLVSYPLLEQGLGRYVEENLGAFLPYFRIDPRSAAAAMGLATGLAVLAALVPARSAARLKVVDAVRKLG